MPLGLMSRLVLPAVMVLMTLAPALGVALTGRDLASHDAVRPLEASPVASWLLRLASLASVAMLAGVLVLHARRLRAAARPIELALILAFGLLFLTNVILPGTFGVTRDIPRAYLYVLLLFVAFYALREHGAELLIGAAKWAILVLLLASLIFAVVWPEATLRPDKAELRLPFVPFRFWGLGSGPNSIGPLALTMILLAMRQPFPGRALQAVALTVAGAVVLLAQSQTTWIAALLIVPLLLAYGRHLERHGPVPVAAPTPGLALGLLGLAAAALLLVLGSWQPGGWGTVAPTGGMPDNDVVLTGRGHIWRVALETFAAHPLFGYGLSAWEAEFRQSIGMQFAVHAHNQLMQSLSVAGVIGALGLAIYVGVLVRASLMAAVASRGLAPALLALMLVRSFSEVPLQVATLLVGDMLMHGLLFAVALAGAGGHAIGTGPARRPC